MININQTNIFKNWYSNLYIAKKTGVTYDYNHNEVPTYGTPVEYTRWNIQYVSSESELLEFGENSSKMKVAVIPNTPKYQGKFAEFDLAYLEGATPTGETINGQNANFRIYSVRPQNTIIKVYFIKIIK